MISVDNQNFVADYKGVFRIDSLPIGRYQVTIKAEGYLPFIKSDVLVVSNKEAVLSIRLTPALYEMDEVVLIPDRPRRTPNNEMASVSAISFEIEETRKLAGGLDDPTRLAANFPGIVAAPFTSENFIAIRGNSPRGLIYRVEGVDIANPNHFARIGSSGGTFTIFSNQVLANSDFFIGAFPAEYGNATSGVFDINFRTGNNEKREYTFQAGVLGFDLAAEGPFKKGGKASYLVNYRLFSLTLAQYLANYVSNTNYQDLSFNINLPTDKYGTFKIFGLGGLSARVKEEETENFTRDIDRFRNYLQSDMGVIGASHTYLMKTGSILKTTVAGSAALMKDNRDYLEDTTDLSTLRPREINEYERQPLSVSTSLKHSFSPRLTVKTGAQFTYAFHDYQSTDFDYIENDFITLANESGTTNTFQAYAQAQVRPNAKWTINGGLHYLYFDLVNAQSLEPRLGMTFQFAPRAQFALGYGLHSRVEDWGTYMTRFVEANGNFSLPNLNLDLMRAHHMVFAYRALISDNLKFQSEVYYQYLFNVPVEEGSESTYSVLNLNELDILRTLVNEGTGRNFGIDLGIERYSDHGFYYLLNGSLFNSTYTDINGRRHYTAYNNGDLLERGDRFGFGYKANFLLGKEFRLGKKKNGNSLLSVNGNLALRGGQRFTPLDLEASRAAQTTVLDETVPFTMIDQTLVVFDFSMNLYKNRKRRTETWSLQIKNMLQSAPAEYREYDATFDREVALRGAGILPVLSYKVEF